MADTQTGSTIKDRDDEEFKRKLKALLENVVPYDPRFPNQNQTKNCQANYRDYYKCLKARNGDEEYCAWYKNAFTKLCPNEWIERWDELREKGAYPHKDCL